MGLHVITHVLIIIASFSISTAKILDRCSTSNQDCGGLDSGLYCFSCVTDDSKCVRSSATNQFKLVNDSLPFNKYGFLTTHNAFAIDHEPSRTRIPRITPKNQEDSITDQLKNGVRGLMLDVYDFKDDIWLCHSFGGHCHDITAFEPLVDTLKEIEAFLSSNPSEIVTIILEDYVDTPNGLTNLFRDTGLMKYWFPVASMPKNGEDWPLVSDMVAKNQRLIVFTSVESKEKSEGIAYQWNYMVENQCKLSFHQHFYSGFEVLIYPKLVGSLGSVLYIWSVTTDGDDGMDAGKCFNREESSVLSDTSKSLVLVNYFRSIPIKPLACIQNSDGLFNMLQTCHDAAANRWANFVAVDYYKRSNGGGTFRATDLLNGELLCNCNDVHACVSGSTVACNS
ncbi:hypothetical protein Leryth_016708 [Lithospermum erythrorhizon]|nr:hypothetical protein Leryth_016708 [Lithospermum erythrorhizon]